MKKELMLKIEKAAQAFQRLANAAQALDTNKAHLGAVQIEFTDAQREQFEVDAKDAHKELTQIIESMGVDL